MCQGNTTCIPDHKSALNETGKTGNNVNESDWEDLILPIFKPDADIVGILLTLLIVIFNSVVFILVVKKRSLRTTTNYFLMGLAASDFLTGLVSLPVSITCNIFQEHGVCFAAICIWNFTSFLTVSHILAVTADRFIAIMYSLRYPQMVTKRRCIIALGFVWSSAFLLSMLQLLWLQPATYDPHDSIAEEHHNEELSFIIGCFVVYLGIPAAFMAFTYLMTVREIRRQNRLQIINVPADLQEQRRWRKREWKAITIFFVMFLTFVISWLPFFLLRYQQLKDAFHLPLWAEYTFAYARFISSLLNPCIYIFGKYDFRNAWEGLCTYKQRERDRARSDLVMIMSSQVFLIR